jgi:chromosome segregation ATPase
MENKHHEIMMIMFGENEERMTENVNQMNSINEELKTQSSLITWSYSEMTQKIDEKLEVNNHKIDNQKEKIKNAVEVDNNELKQMMTQNKDNVIEKVQTLQARIEEKAEEQQNTQAKIYNNTKIIKEDDTHVSNQIEEMNDDIKKITQLEKNNSDVLNVVNLKNDETKEGLTNINEKVEAVESMMEKMEMYINELNNGIEIINAQISQIWQTLSEMKDINGRLNEGIQDVDQHHNQQEESVNQITLSLNKLNASMGKMMYNLNSRVSNIGALLQVATEKSEKLF